jgi:membrane protein DedA with SNARE-associated domain
MLRRMLSSLAHWVQHQVAANGLQAVFALMVLESACIPIPSEVTMVYAGYLVSQGSMSFVAAVLVGSVANLVGSLIAWGAGAYGVDAALVRSPRNRAHLAQANRWFERYGSPVVFFSRMLPVIRTFISLPAGMARMPLGRFAALTFLGSIPWCIMLVAVGDVAGANWDTWHKRIGYLDYVVVLAVAAVAVFWLLRRRRVAGH